MAQNFLYMFEFVVDNLLVTRPNKCAPEEYPTCCEISFRSSVYVTICDREYGRCVDTCSPKCGKCCLFSLECPINNKDRLLIHVYKKKNETCKFLLGATEMPIKPLFDKVTDDFDIENPNWMDAVTRHHALMPDPKNAVNKKGGKSPQQSTVCDDDFEGRREQFCQTSEVSKGLLPLFNMKGEQTGNLMLIVRLVCNGPAIVTISNFCPPSCAKRCKSRSPKNGASNMTCKAIPMPDPCKKPDETAPPCRRYFACNEDKGCPCDECEDHDRECIFTCKKDPCKPKKKPKSPCCAEPSDDFDDDERDDVFSCPDLTCLQSKKKKKANKSSCCVPSPPCCSPPPCGQQKPKRKRSCGGADTKCDCCDDFCGEKCDAEDSCSDDSADCCDLQPCYIEPSRPDPGRDAYEEFEACLNGSGLTIRVLKDTHQMETILDGTENNLDDSGSECGGPSRKSCGTSDCAALHQLLNNSKFAQNALRRRTAGSIVNNPQIPKVRANIKYAGADTGCLENYRIPFTKIKNVCNSMNKVDMYRKQRNNDDCGPIEPPMRPDDTRSCCLQVDPNDIKDMLKGINVDARKKGIEVCYKTCDDTESDVFLVKLGAKKSCERKQHSVEIELKTPKVPIPCPVQKCTTETQIQESELNAAFGAGRKKGKKGKKGKGMKK